MIWSINIQPFLQFGINSKQFFFYFIFHIKIKKYGFGPLLILIIWDSISVRMRMYIRLSFLKFWRKDFFTLLMQRSQLHLLEQLPLSLCTYPPPPFFFIFFFFLFSFLFYSVFTLFVFGKQDLAQDCPFLIPGFLWIWKLSLSKFPYQGSIQLSP